MNISYIKSKTNIKPHPKYRECHMTVPCYLYIFRGEKPWNEKSVELLKNQTQIDIITPI